MTDKELQKLKRPELLELLLQFSVKNHKLEEENAKLRAEAADRQIALDEAGSIAEASLKLNGVFTAAQAAAEQYLENIKSMNDTTQAKADAMLGETRAQCDRMRREAQNDVDGRWSVLKASLDEYCAAHEGLQEQLVKLVGDGNVPLGGKPKA